VKPILALLLLTSVTHAEEEPEAPEPPPPPAYSFSGYLQPQIGFTHRPSGLPRDRWEYGAGATSAGVGVEGEPVPHWSYAVELVFAGEFLDVVTGVEAVDEDGDGMPDDVAAEDETTPAFLVEEASVRWEAHPMFAAKLGQMRIPFTIQQQISNTALMFPQRSDANEVFLSGTDLGALATVTAKEGVVVAHGGIFNGTGAPTGFGDERGILWAGRLDVSPLGEFAFEEGDPERGPLRVGLGAGVLYYPANLYDEGGYPGARIRDLRASGSFRLSARGFYLQAEVLRRQRTDSLSSRAQIATGAYAQASFTFAAGPVLLAPLGRIGWAEEDSDFMPRETLWTELGLALYPHPADPEAIRLIVQYLGQRQITENESAHGAALQAQLAF
jgi:hypothetical protein